MFGCMKSLSCMHCLFAFARWHCCECDVIVFVCNSAVHFLLNDFDSCAIDFINFAYIFPRHNSCLRFFRFFLQDFRAFSVLVLYELINYETLNSTANREWTWTYVFIRWACCRWNHNRVFCIRQIFSFFLKNEIPDNLQDFVVQHCGIEHFSCQHWISSNIRVAMSPFLARVSMSRRNWPTKRSMSVRPIPQRSFLRGIPSVTLQFVFYFQFLSNHMMTILHSPQNSEEVSLNFRQQPILFVPMFELVSWKLQYLYRWCERKYRHLSNIIQHSFSRRRNISQSLAHSAPEWKPSHSQFFPLSLCNHAQIK